MGRLMAATRKKNTATEAIFKTTRVPFVGQRSAPVGNRARSVFAFIVCAVLVSGWLRVRDACRRLSHQPKVRRRPGTACCSSEPADQSHPLRGAALDCNREPGSRVGGPAKTP